MGKRSTSTTKSGKYMNPTDQARKEARKRELKKNKKQRQLVRAAVLKGKNPRELIVELEKIDDMEYNPLAPPPLNEKVLREKRRKLVETWNRVIQMYEKEDPEQYAELKKVWNNYQMRLNEITTHYEAVRNAQNVRIDDIPLPNTVGPGDEDGDFTDIPLPPSSHLQPKAGILKKPSVFESLRPKVCPGVPLGPPPLLSDYLEDEDEASGGKEQELERKRKIRFAEEERSEVNDEKEDKDDDDEDEQEEVGVPGEEPFGVTAFAPKDKPKVDDLQKRMLAMAGQDVDAYLKEMEEVHRQTQAEKAAQLQSRMDAMGQQQQQQQPEVQPRRFGAIPPGPPPGLPPSFAPPGMIVRPGVPPPGVRLPPGPPPGRPTLRMPPGPPPGIPPVRLGAIPTGARPPPMPRPLLGPVSTGVVSAGPQLIQKEAKVVATSASPAPTNASVIESKPKIRNLLNDVTRFVPTKVKVHMKDEKALGGSDQAKRSKLEPKQDVFAKHSQPVQNPPTNKDDAYAQFMKEMEQMMK